MEKNERYNRGWEKLKQIDSEAGERTIESLKEIAPDFAKFLIEFPFGDIYFQTCLRSKIPRNSSNCSFNCTWKRNPAA